MSAMDDLVKMLKKQKRTGTDYTGIVTRIDGGTAYVRLTGSRISDTPCALTISAKVGDRVRVRVSGGRAWVTGNDTAPPTNDVENIKVVTKNAENTASELRQLREEFDAEQRTIVRTQTNVSVPNGQPYEIHFPLYGEFVSPPQAVIGITFPRNSDYELSGGTLYMWPKDVSVGVVEIDEYAVVGHVYNATGKTRTVSFTCIMTGKARR